MSSRALFRRAAKAVLLHRAARREPCPGIRVLAYHLLPDARRFSSHVDAMRSVADIIDEHAFLAAVAGSRPWPVARTEVLLTFDDGYRQIIDAGGDGEARRLDIRPIVFALAAGLVPRLGAVNRLMSDRRGAPYSLCDRADLRRLVESGWSVGSHTATHWDCGLGTKGDFEREIRLSKEALVGELGVSVRCFAFPWGKHANASGEALAEVAASGYEASFSTYRGAIAHRPMHHASFLPRDVVDPWWGSEEILGCLAGGLDARGGATPGGPS